MTAEVPLLHELRRATGSNHRGHDGGDDGHDEGRRTNHHCCCGCCADATELPAALSACCGQGAVGKHGGNVHRQGEVCMSHMRRHNASLVDLEVGCDLHDEQRFCDPCGVGAPFCDPSCNGLPQRGGLVPEP